MKYRLFFLLIFFIILLFVGIIGFSGSYLTSIQGVGAYQIEVISNGIALYQHSQPLKGFYSISPVNDYIIDKNGIRSTLLTFEDLKNGKYKTSFNKIYLFKLIDSLLSYFNLYHPTISFTDNNNQHLKYSLSIMNDSLTVVRDITLKKGFYKAFGSTITFQPEDIIFDRNGIIYYGKNYQEELYNQFKLYPIYDLTTDSRVRISENTLFIINPSMSDVIVIHKGRNSDFWIDKSYYLIEQETHVDFSKHILLRQEIEILTYDKFRKLLN